MRKLVKSKASEDAIQSAKTALTEITRTYKKLLRKENNSHNISMYNKSKHRLY